MRHVYIQQFIAYCKQSYKFCWENLIDQQYHKLSKGKLIWAWQCSDDEVFTPSPPSPSSSLWITMGPCVSLSPTAAERVIALYLFLGHRHRASLFCDHGHLSLPLSPSFNPCNLILITLHGLKVQILNVVSGWRFVCHWLSFVLFIVFRKGRKEASRCRVDSKKSQLELLERRSGKIWAKIKSSFEESLLVRTLLGDKEAIMLIDCPRLSITQRCQSPKQRPINPLSLKTYLWSIAMEILVSGQGNNDYLGWKYYWLV